MSWLQQIRKSIFASGVVQALNRNADARSLAADAALAARRQVDELLGMLQGVVADGIVQHSEVDFLIRWLEQNKDAIDRWPAKAIYPRLKAALSDGGIDRSEEAEIRELIQAALDENASGSRGDAFLNYTEPLPSIEFSNHLFCFTGRFRSGNHPWCISQIIARGGMSAGTVSPRVNYLVVGEIARRGGSAARLDRKLANAIKYRRAGVEIAIVSEQYWFEQLMLHAQPSL